MRENGRSCAAGGEEADTDDDFEIGPDLVHGLMAMVPEMLEAGILENPPHN